MKQNKENTPEEILNDLFTFAHGDEDTSEFSTSEVSEFVKTKKVNLQRMMREVNKKAEQAKKQARLKTAQAEREKALRGRTDAPKGEGAGLIESIRTLIDQLRGQDGELAQVFFNRLQAAEDEDDLRSIKEDLDLLDWLEERDEGGS